MNAISPAFGCTAGAMPFDAARDRVLSLVAGPLPGETVDLADCPGRVLAEPILARLDLPRFDQSAMDGYAVCRAGLTPGMSLPVTGSTAAGEAPRTQGPGEAVRILTGAPLPLGADAVIAQENVHRHGDLIDIEAIPPAGTNVRRQGEDIRAGQVLISAGTILDWRHVTVLAAQGVSIVPVRRRPRITVLSSGRELRTPDQPLGAGQIHDSNSPMLVALLRASGAAVRTLAIVADMAPAMETALHDAARDTDIVITTAGISVGDEDHVRDALHALGGDLAVLSVAMKPGKPLAAGRLGGAVFIGLPGNPQAALAGAVAFVRPLLARMAGSPATEPRPVRAGFAIRRKPGRTEFIPVRLRQRGTGLWAERAGPDGSGRLAPLLHATGFAVLPPHATEISEGTVVEYLPFLPDAGPEAAYGPTVQSLAALEFPS